MPVLAGCPRRPQIHPPVPGCPSGCVSSWAWNRLQVLLTSIKTSNPIHAWIQSGCPGAAGCVDCSALSPYTTGIERSTNPSPGPMKKALKACRPTQNPVRPALRLSFRMRGSRVLGPVNPHWMRRYFPIHGSGRGLTQPMRQRPEASATTNQSEQVASLRMLQARQLLRLDLPIPR